MSTTHLIGNTTEHPDIGAALADTDLFLVHDTSAGLTKSSALSRVATYLLGAARTFTAALLSNSATGGIGYATGAGGAVTQATSASTGVTLNKVTGQITTVALTTAAAAEERFTVTNSTVAATDVVALSTTYNGNGTPMLSAVNVTAGAFDVVVTNAHASAAFNAVMVINFAVVKGVAA